MLFGMSTIILKWSHSPDIILFRYSCFKIGQSEPRVAYKSVANKKKRVSDERTDSRQTHLQVAHRHKNGVNNSVFK